MNTYRTDAINTMAALMLLEIGKAISSEYWDEGTYIVLGEDGEFIDEVGDVVAFECSNVNDVWYLVERTSEDAINVN